MNSLKDLLQDRQLFFVEPGWTVSQAACRMSALRVGAILVLEQGQLRGLFSERDLMTRVVVAGLNPDRTLVRDVMSTELATIEETATSESAMEMMQHHNCRHLPVTRESGVVCMISMRDLMNHELELKIEENRHMRAYISSTG
jgi:signal-transduction protein with cAMP-binding, CBS, and nucleotidyltransferase domain